MLTFTSLTVENFGPFKGTQTIDFREPFVSVADQEKHNVID